MKKLLLLLLVSLSALAWRSEEIMRGLGMARTTAAPSTPALNVQAGQDGHKAMTMGEFAELSKTDPQAYRKLINSLQVPEERSAVDKLMNFLAHGKYE
ncbi:MAG TPA: hypothetical protein VJ652_20390 [Noviherbaspirillum sp.]|nr:hypothetical protein [Noviherbaspirillum sp.]